MTSQKQSWLWPARNKADYDLPQTRLWPARNKADYNQPETRLIMTHHKQGYDQPETKLTMTSQKQSWLWPARNKADYDQQETRLMPPCYDQTKTRLTMTSGKRGYDQPQTRLTMTSRKQGWLWPATNKAGILHTPAGMGGTALVVAVASPRKSNPNFPQGIMKYKKIQKTTQTHQSWWHQRPWPFCHRTPYNTALHWGS